MRWLRPRAANTHRMSAVTFSVVALVGIGCGRSATHSSALPTELRIGIGQLPLTTPQNGIREIVQNLSIESLFSFAAEDGRPRPALAERWTVEPGWRSVVIRLRSDVKFH